MRRRPVSGRAGQGWREDQSFRDGRSLWKTGSANPPNTDEETGPRGCSSCPSRVPKAGKTEEAGSVPTVLPPARSGLGEQAAKTVLCPFSSLAVGTQGGCGHPLPSSSHTSVIHPRQSPVWLGRGLGCFLLHSSPICIPSLPFRPSEAFPCTSWDVCVLVNMWLGITSA